MSISNFGVTVVVGVGPQGPAGPTGPAGPGVAPGGTTGQTLVKASNADYDTEWSSAGSGTVTSISVTTANGVSGTVATPTTTPAITLSLGAITPSSVASSGAVTGSNLTGVNTGDQLTFKTIAVSGQPDIVAESTTDTLNIAAGANITITTDASTDTVTISGSASTPPGGLNTQVQFNDGGSFGGDAGFTYNKTTDTATIGNLALTNALPVSHGGTGATSQAGARTNLGLGTASVLDSSTDGTLSANSDSLLPTQKAVKTYVDNAVTGLLDLKGSTDCSTNPNYPAALKGDAYVVSVAGKIGGASGITVEPGDVYFALADNAGGTQASVGTSWDVLQYNLSGVLLAANNLSDVQSASSARTNLGLAIGTNVQAYDATLQALSSYNTNGILTQTAPDTFAGRTLTGTSARVSVTNGNGVSGNPTVDIDSGYVGQTSITTLGTIATGVWNGTAVPVTNGGTGATSAATAFSNLGGGAIGKLASLFGGIVVTIGDGINPIPAGVTISDPWITNACTITSWTIAADQVGSIVLDVWKSSYASYPPVVGGSITGSQKPTLSSAIKNQNLNPNTWTTTLSQGDSITVKVDSASTVTRVVLVLQTTRTT